MAHTANLNQIIDQQLRLHRPDRYNVNEAEWLNEVADSIPAEVISSVEIRKLYMRHRVGERERNATRKANRILRAFNKSDQLELHWWNEANEPISIEWREFSEDERESTRLERVALRAVEPRDLRMWAENEEVDAQRDYEARMDAVNGARKIAADMEAGGYTRFDEWAEATFPAADVG